MQYETSTYLTLVQKNYVRNLLVAPDYTLPKEYSYSSTHAGITAPWTQFQVDSIMSKYI